MNFKDRFHPFCAAEITFNTLEEMKSRLLSLDAEKILLVMSQSSIRRWGLKGFIDGMENFHSLCHIDHGPQNPTQEDLCNALKLMSMKKDYSSPDCIIAVGGGSAIDLAKGIAAFCPYKKSLSVGEITKDIKAKRYSNSQSCPPILAVPTTAGTGSEVTQWATLWDVSKQGKFSIDAPGLKPQAAMIVPELTMTLPEGATLSTGLDALSHAIEAYWSKNTTPLVRDIAYRAIELIVSALKPTLTLLKQPSQDKGLLLPLRMKMCQASVLAGLAFSQTRTTACHSLSYPMTLYKEVPHGLAVAMTLGAVGERNRGHFPNSDELFELFTPLGSLQNWLDDVCAGILTLRLSHFGITQEDIPFLANHSFTSGRMDNNPVALTLGDVESILKQVF